MIMVNLAGAREVVARRAREVGKDLERPYAARQAAEAGSEIAAACADLEDAIVGLHCECLQDPALETRREHVLAMPERHAQVGEGELTIRRWREFLARHTFHDREDPGIEHFPRPNLLFDHLATGGD